MTQQSRKQHTVQGDGNCLFRCFSFYLYGNEDHHFAIRSLLVQFIDSNPESFIAYCFPLSVGEHVQKMKKNYIWGSHCEIAAVALLFKIPVFVALKKHDGGPYYWAKFSTKDTEYNRPDGIESLTVPNHIELCHIGNHYNIVMSSNGSLPQTMPYQEDTSSNEGSKSVVL